MRSIVNPCLLLAGLLFSALTAAQPAVPTFTRTLDGHTYTLAGHDPARRGTTVIPTVLVPLRLTFDTTATVMDAATYVPRMLASPVFAKYRFGAGAKTQYGDALLAATFPGPARGHTLLGAPRIQPVTIHIPAAYGYVLHSRADGRAFAIVDTAYVESELFKQLPREPGRLVIAVALNTAFYAAGDATVCCGWGTHGVDPATGSAFVLSAYLHAAPPPVGEHDVQPLTEQLAEYFYDPLHDPRNHFHVEGAPGNYFAAWRRPGDPASCAGRGVGSNYFLLEPTDTNLKNDFPASAPHVARADGFDYHLQNVALLEWYLGAAAHRDGYGFPDAGALRHAAVACEAHRESPGGASGRAAAPVAAGATNHGHWLIGYWTGARFGGQPFPIRDVAPQWDVVLVAFAPPAPDAPPGTMAFAPPKGITPAELKQGIADLRQRGTRVMLSLGGGGRYFKLDEASAIPRFVDSVSAIVKQYGFEGVDIDFESPSLELAPGDTDFRHPVTPSIVNLIAALRELRARFGPQFMLSLVPEGTQISGGLVSYGGQFGSELPLVYALRDELSFVDVQEYNTPPLEGLDGAIYQVHTVDYAVAMTELLLHGFNVAGDPHRFFPPLPADKIAVGFLVGYDTPELVGATLRELVSGKAPPNARYALRKSGGYPALLGAMFWTIDADRRQGYRYSNPIGPELHAWPAVK